MGKTNTMFVLYMRELMYDIENKTYLTGRSKSDASPADVAHMQVTERTEENNQVLRSIGAAYRSLFAQLAEWLNIENTTRADDGLIANTDIVINLLLPGNFNKGMHEVIADAMHNYIVNMAVSDWFSMTNKGDAGLYAEKAVADVAKLKEAINKRYRPTRN